MSCVIRYANLQQNTSTSTKFSPATNNTVCNYSRWYIDSSSHTREVTEHLRTWKSLLQMPTQHLNAIGCQLAVTN